jgi:hypothetical protein
MFDGIGINETIVIIECFVMLSLEFGGFMYTLSQIKTKNLTGK